MIPENFQQSQDKFFETLSQCPLRLLVPSYEPRDVKSKTLPLSGRSEFRLVCFCFLKFLGIIDTLIQSQVRGLLLGTTWQFSFLSWNQLCSGASHSLESPSLRSLAQEREPTVASSLLAACRAQGKEGLLSFPRGFRE